jgi:peptidylprolyl isomerase
METSNDSEIAANQKSRLSLPCRYAGPKRRGKRRHVMADEQNILVLSLDSGGDVVIKLRPDLAPQHVARIKELAQEGFYDGVVFHRVIDGFMAQGGDPTGSGMGGSDRPDLPAEFSREPHVRGTASMARSNNPNSANSQFFICFDDAASSTANIRSGARWWKGWSMSTPCPRASRRASRARSSRRASGTKRRCAPSR